MEDGQITGLTLSNGEEIKSRRVVLAVGHSARDTFEMLHERGVYGLNLSLLVRIEHKQAMIDEARFGKNAGNPIWCWA